MRRVYRRTPGITRALAAVTLLFALACGGAANESAPGKPGRGAGSAGVPQVEPYELTTLLGSRGFAAVALTPDGNTLLARATDGRSLLWNPPEPRPREIAPDASFEPLGLFPDGRRGLAFEAGGTPEAPRRLFRFELNGARALLPIALHRPRLLGFAADGSAFLLAGAREGGAAAAYEVAAETLVTQLVAELPPGFEFAAAAADGGRLAARRELHPEADELYLHERASGETRLVLPAGDDARFRPVGFGPGGETLLILTDVGADRLGLAWLDLASGHLRPLPAPSLAGCEVVRAELATDGSAIATTAVCDGVRQAHLLEAESGAELALPPLPAGVRAVEALAAPRSSSGGGPLAIAVASARLPRDLLWQAAGSPVLVPLTWGLAPGVDPRLISGAGVVRVTAGGTSLPIELWPAAAAVGGAPRAGLVWIENDSRPPAWDEFDPFFQFLAGRGLLVARLRLRGADGFGRAFRHSADGRLLESAREDVEAAMRELVSRGADPARVALVGQGGWPGAIVATFATGGSAPESAAAPSPSAPGMPAVAGFIAFAALGADPDPLARIDILAALSEPAKSWWIARLGDPADPRTHAARLATAVTHRAGTPPAPALSPLFEGPLEPDYEALWSFLAPHLEAR